MHPSFSKLHILLEKTARSAQIGTGPYQGINRRVSGNLFPDQGSIARRTWLDVGLAETQTADAARFAVCAGRNAAGTGVPVSIKKANYLCSR
jgi:hypothetical protein